MREKLKSLVLDDTVFYAFLVVSVALVSFLLGRNSLPQSPNQAAGVQISQVTPAIVPDVEPTSVTTQLVNQVVASRSGTKYHLPGCPGAKQIKEANQVWFASIEFAQAAGYSAAANCPGLE